MSPVSAAGRARWGAIVSRPGRHAPLPPALSANFSEHVSSLGPRAADRPIFCREVDISAASAREQFHQAEGLHGLGGSISSLMVDEARIRLAAYPKVTRWIKAITHR